MSLIIQHVLYTILMLIILLLVSNCLFSIGNVNIQHSQLYINELKKSNNVLQSTLEQEVKLLSSLQENKHQLKTEINHQNKQFQQNIMKLLSAANKKKEIYSKKPNLLNKTDIKKLLSYCQKRDNDKDN